MGLMPFRGYRIIGNPTFTLRDAIVSIGKKVLPEIQSLLKAFKISNFAVLELPPEGENHDEAACDALFVVDGTEQR
ncbi:ATV_HP_G0067800.mRNA.1.CDS.1 [Saccharomyces cerevisiae]|nr:ATV_HP_G0067800.mRNA.1.CDS.1 [Saccharomyces cerevisiae]CAI7002732.1 ATV_HP_G0067800.mRNA.1.CDS.1 [Saccharomyces cerevisiae]